MRSSHGLSYRTGWWEGVKVSQPTQGTKGTWLFSVDQKRKKYADGKATPKWGVKHLIPRKTHSNWQVACSCVSHHRKACCTHVKTGLPQTRQQERNQQGGSAVVMSPTSDLCAGMQWGANSCSSVPASMGKWLVMKYSYFLIQMNPLFPLK